MASAAPSSESRSASTWITETINGSHDFKIQGYSLNKGLGVGKYISSEAFSIGGYSWKIRFYPDGDGDGDGDGDEDEDEDEHEDEPKSYVSLYLALDSNATDVRAIFKATLFDQSGDQCHMVKSETCTFAKQLDNWGWSHFLWRADLENGGYLYDDCLHFCGRVSVLRSHHGYLIRLPPSNMIQRLGRLLESGEGADVNFKVDGEFFSSHQLILAAHSPVFKAQFFGPMKDHTPKCITIEDMEIPIFKAMLHFIYWDELPDLKDLIGDNSKWTSIVICQHLLVAADRYDLDRLKLLCAAKLCNNIAIDTVATTLTLAEQHNCLPLKVACLEFVARTEKLQDVMKRDDFKYLRETLPHLYIDILEHIAGINKHDIAASK